MSPYYHLKVTDFILQAVKGNPNGILWSNIKHRLQRRFGLVVIGHWHEVRSSLLYLIDNQYIKRMNNTAEESYMIGKFKDPIGRTAQEWLGIFNRINEDLKETYPEEVVTIFNNQHIIEYYAHQIYLICEERIREDQAMMIATRMCNLAVAH